MQPLQLEIQGINSFKDRQVIDFEKLFEGGIFGIFGPTGSGKSTVLDSLFLSLYGKMERANKSSGFINVGMSEARVALTFVVNRDDEKRKYKVERVFKLVKNGETKQSARLCYYEFDEEVVKCETVEDVNAEIIDLVGFYYEDFKRCVSLSQGEFNSFIKESHSERVQAIARIFDLHKFGNKLDTKIAKKVTLEEKNVFANEARLQTYGDYTRESVSEKTALLAGKKEECRIIKNDIRELGQTVTLGHDLLQGKRRLAEVELLLGEYEKQDGVISDNSKTLNFAKCGSELMPKLEGMLAEERKVLASSNELKNLYVNLNENSSHEVNEHNKYEQLKDAAYTDIIKLNSKIDKLEMLKPDVKRLSELLTLRDEILSEYENYERNLHQKVVERDSLSDLLAKSEKYIEILSAEVANVSVSKEAVKTITLARDIEIEKRTYQAQQKQLEEELAKISERKRAVMSDVKRISFDANDFRQKLLRADDRVREVYGTNTTRFETLCLLANENIARHKVVEVARFINHQIKALKEHSESASLDVKEYANKAIKSIEMRKKIDSDRKQFQIELDRTTENREEYLSKNFLTLMMNNLDTNEKCPVCEGVLNKLSRDNKVSLEPYENEIKVVKNRIAVCYESYNTADCVRGEFEARADELERQVDIDKQRIAELISERDRLLANYNVEADGGDEASLNEILKYSDEKVAKLEQLVNASNQLEKDISDKDKVVERLKAEVLSLDTVEESLSKRHEQVTKIVDELTLQYFKYEEVLKGTSARSISEIIMDNDGKKARTIVKLAEQKEVKQSCLMHIKELEGEINELKIKMNSIASLSSGYEKERLELTRRINLYVPNGSSVEKEQQFCIDSIQKLRLNEQHQRVKYEKVAELIHMIENLIAEKKASYRLMLSELNLKKKEGLELLKEAGFESVNHLKNSLLDKDSIVRLESTIKNYTKERAKLLEEKEKLVVTTLGFNLSDEEFVAVKERLENSKVRLMTLDKEILLEENAISEARDKIRLSQEIKQEIIAQRAELKKLEKLKKLVGDGKLLEYVAVDYIDMIATSASEILLKLTSGRYYLTYDSKEMEIIDNISGGVKRDVFTLSGGETFLVSLSVSMALSGLVSNLSKRPINMFFLDEGFGTLDRELVETVSMSLERLENSNMQIGIISHVPELQERVKKKILLLPAKEKEGSRIKVIC